MQVARNSGEPDQIIHDNIHRAADGESRNLSHIQCFRGDSLPRKRSVAVHQHWNDFFSAGFSRAGLFCARASHGDWIDGFQMARIGNKVDSDRPPVRGRKIPRRAHVILHVSTAQHAARIHVLESRKNLCSPAAHDVHHDIQSAPVAHCQHRLLQALFRSRAQDCIQQWQQSRFTLERITLRSQIAGLQDLLENFRAHQPFQNSFAIDFRSL